MAAHYHSLPKLHVPEKLLLKSPTSLEKERLWFPMRPVCYEIVLKDPPENSAGE
jgi:hypothetical protein